MYTFALKEIEEVSSKLKIFKLFVNDSCEFDDFFVTIKKEGNLTSELKTIQARLMEIAECKSLPDTKFKDITPKKETIKEYEAKTKNLRVYMFHEQNTGRIIICGGKKSNQKKDLQHFRNIKKQYFHQKK